MSVFVTQFHGTCHTLVEALVIVMTLPTPTIEIEFGMITKKGYLKSGLHCE